MTPMQPQQLELPMLPPVPMPVAWNLTEMGALNGKPMFMLSMSTPAGVNHFWFSAEELSDLANKLRMQALGLAIVA